jgi:hypothetical protein
MINTCMAVLERQILDNEAMALLACSQPHVGVLRFDQLSRPAAREGSL